MTRATISARSQFIAFLRLLIGAVSMLILLACSVGAQQTSSTDGQTPLGLAPGAPAGSYALSDLDQVNLFNGNLNFGVPIGHIGGRGSAGYTMMVRPSSTRWRVWRQPTMQCDQNGCQVTGNHYYPSQNWWEVLSNASPGIVIGRYGGDSPYYSSGCSMEVWSTALTRITFTAADGTEYELRDQLLGGQPKLWLGNSCTQGTLRGKVFVSGDGSAVTFISDTNYYDKVDASPQNFFPSGYILFRDGTRYRIDAGAVSWIRDRNGNEVTFANGTATDSLNRQISIANPITFKGFGGATRTVQISNASLSTRLRPCRTDPGYQCYSPQTYFQLFPSLEGSSSSTFDPGVMSAITLPDGRQYQFYYNSYGELARVDLPTGGVIEFDYSGSSGGTGVISGTYPGDPYSEFAVYRRVVERRVYPDGVTLESKTTYSMDVNPTVVDHLKATGELISREKHYFSGSPSATFFTGANSYPSYTDGREYQTQVFGSDGTTELRRVNNNWQQGCAVSQWSNTVPNNPHIADSTSTIEPTGANQVSKQTFGFDCYNNPTDTYEYDFGTGAPAVNYTRRTHTDYLTVNPVNGGAYDALNPSTTNPDINATYHLRSLPKQQSVYDAGGVERARTTYEYDNYASDANHAALMPRSNISGLCTVITSPTLCDNTNPPGYLSRGNVTATTRSLLVNGSVTGSISAYAQYDIVGNVVKAIDGRGYATNIDYNDRFGAPDGEAQSNSAPALLAGLTSFAFATKVTNAFSQTSYGQFDYYLGRPVDGEDVNGVVASGYYSDLLDRPTKIIRARNQTVENQTTFTYDDIGHTITTTSDLNTNNDPAPLTSKVIYDDLGRTIETRQYEGGTNYIATQTQYDALGRAYKVSNPFRPWQSETVIWTTTGFDALGRINSVTTPDSAVVTTSFVGNFVTVTDQTGKQRKSVTDALGRLRQVYEAPNDANYNYLTSYDYDTLDNLTTVTQGTQTRSFAYDSLKRLTAATNPESGSINYQYDENGNLLVKTDARSVSTHFAYDALNRVSRRWYNGSSATTATTNNSPVLPSGVGASNEANFYYDSQSLPAGAPTFSRGVSTGRLVALTYGTSSSAGDYYGYDSLGRQTLKIQQIGGINYQLTPTYNLAGAITALTYPSGHTITNLYDSAGRMSSFIGNLGDGASRTYSTGMIYSSLGGITKEQFGTTTPIYNKLFYNVRGQLSEIRDSTSYTGPTDTTWNRGAIINHYSDQCWGMCSGHSMTDNNGNLKHQDNYIPDNEQVTSYHTFTDSFAYDSLNRLQTVAENYYVSSTNQTTTPWQQSYSYDRYGNRTINTINQTPSTYGTGINNIQFAVDPMTNRLYAPNDPSHTLMDYDLAGNLKQDSYTGAGGRTYDGENRMISAWGGNNQSQVYTYDANGQRVRRKVDNVETWQVYGMAGELVAEYPMNGGVSSPQKEYGYRNGQVLVTAEAPSTTLTPQNVSWTNVSSTIQVTGNSLLKVSGTSSWYDAGAASSQTIAAGDGYMEFTPGDTSTWRMCGLGNTDTITYFADIKYAFFMGGAGDLHIYESGTDRGYNGVYAASDRLKVAVEGGVVKYYRNGSLVYTSTVTPQYPLRVDTSLNTVNSYLGNVVITNSSLGNVNWLVTDQLGTPRMVFDQTGGFANVKRHDYLPFGEELFAPAGGRSTAQGYSVSDGIRQKFTQKERDNETLLDFLQSRYYSSTQGRFTSPDSFVGRAVNPQTLNLYSYVRNNPLKYVDRTGHSPQDPNRPHPNKPCSEESPCDPDDHDTVKTNTDQKKNEPVGGGIDWLAWDRWSWEQNRRAMGFSFGIVKFQLSPVSSIARLVGGEDAVTNLHHLSMGVLPLSMEVRAEAEAEEVSAAMEGELDDLMEEGLVYRAGGFTEQNFTPRLDDTKGLSTFDSPAGVFENSSSNSAQVIDTSKLVNLRASPDPPPEGHVSIRPGDAAGLRAWAETRGSTTTHPFTTELINARVGSVRRQN